MAFWHTTPHIEWMAKPDTETRAERMRLAAETGAQARAAVQASDIAIRKNMQRLRDLRLAKEAEDAAAALAEVKPVKPPRVKAVKKLVVRKIEKLDTELSD